MAPIKGTQARLLVDGYDFSTDTSSVTVDVATETMDATALQASGKTQVTLDPTGTISLAGYFVGTTVAVDDGQLEKEMYDRLGVANTVIAAVILDTSGTRPTGYVLPSTSGAGLTLAAPVAGLITVEGEFSAGTLRRGYQVFRGTISATGTQTSIDFGAAGSAGGLAYLFIQTITGTATNATIDIESSTTEGGAYASEGTFTFSAIGVQTVTMSGTVNRWLRLNCTAKGGATSFVVLCVACVSGVTYAVA